MTFIINDYRILDLLSEFEAEFTLEAALEAITRIYSASSESSLINLNSLLEKHIFVAVDHYDENVIDDIDHWVKRGWSEALYLHLFSNDICYDDESSETPSSYKDGQFEGIMSSEPQPDLWKIYTELTYVPLPKVKNNNIQNLEQAILTRRSNQPFIHGETSLADFSALLQFGFEAANKARIETEEKMESSPKVFVERSSFSPFEGYVTVFNVEGIDPGLYHYNMKDHAIAKIRDGVFQAEISEICIGQRKPSQGNFVILLSAIWDRYQFRYRHPRAYRNLLINTGELAQKFLVKGSELNHEQFLTPALNDEVASDFIGMNTYDESVLYVLAFG